MNTSPADDRSGQPARAFSRRTMLHGLGIAGLTAALAPLLLNHEATAVAAPNRAARRAMKGRAPRRRGAPAAAQPTPYVLQASSELSREFFMTSEVMIQQGDYVYPFVNPRNGNQVEALVFAGGNLSHLRRDVTSPTGWSFVAFDLQGLFNSVNDVAVAANGTDVYVLVFGYPSGNPNENPSNAPAWLTRLTGAATWDSGITATYDKLNQRSEDGALAAAALRAEGAEDLDEWRAYALELEERLAATEARLRQELAVEEGDRAATPPVVAPPQTRARL